eukprot:2268040-Pleurochrysis_carterae.AAC.2
MAPPRVFLHFSSTLAPELPLYLRPLPMFQICSLMHEMEHPWPLTARTHRRRSTAHVRARLPAGGPQRAAAIVTAARARLSARDEVCRPYERARRNRHSPSRLTAENRSVSSFRAACEAQLLYTFDHVAQFEQKVQNSAFASHPRASSRTFPANLRRLPLPCRTSVGRGAESRAHVTPRAGVP